MPWVGPFQEGDQHCVYKENPDGTRGEKEGCSATKEMAIRHMRALYANAGDKSGEKYVLGNGWREKGDELDIFVYGTPYFGPNYLNGKDIQNEYFTPQTDFGPLSRTLSYFDHGKAINDPVLSQYPDFAEGLVGVADLVGSDDVGVIWKIIVDKAYKYKSLIKKLVENDLLNASSSPFQRSVKIDKSTGKIERWHVVEVGLTFAGANPNAEVLLKSILLEESDMAQDTNVQDATTEENVEVTTTPVENPVTEAVRAIAEGDAVTAENQEEKSLADLIAELNSNVSEMRKELSTVSAKQGEAEKSIVDLNMAIPELAKMISKSLKTTVQSEVDKSTVERAVQNQVNRSVPTTTQLPANAPGRERRARQQ
jgi:hypothetical protein